MRPASAWRRDAKGNVAVMMALILLPVMCVIGLALDTSRLESAKMHAQDSLDAAVLAAAVSENAHKAKKAFDASLIAKNIDPNTASLSFETAGNYYVARGQLDDKIDTGMTAILGVEQMTYDVDAAARAPLMITDVALSATNAYGLFNKVVEFKVRRPDGTEEVVIRIDYVMTDPYGDNGRGTGTTTLSPSSAVKIGKYTELWAEMTVDDILQGKTVVYSTRNADQAHHLFVNGEPLPQGKLPDVFDFVHCNTSAPHAWEDSPSGFNEQDIFFTASFVCTEPDKNKVMLTN